VDRVLRPPPAQPLTVSTSNQLLNILQNGLPRQQQQPINRALDNPPTTQLALPTMIDLQHACEQQLGALGKRLKKI
jgi:hypothetical protein